MVDGLGEETVKDFGLFVLWNTLSTVVYPYDSCGVVIQPDLYKPVDRHKLERIEKEIEQDAFLLFRVCRNRQLFSGKII